MWKKTSGAEDEMNRKEPGTSAQETPKRFVCDVCGQTCSREYTLAVHKRTHSCIPFSCSYCGKEFSRRNSLYVHTRTQTGGGPYQCTVCGESFVAKCILTQHGSTHSVYKPHKCTQCERSFKRKSQLTEHMLSHSKEKPFKCDRCEKSFIRKGRLENHKQNYHNEENLYRCHHCKRAFSALKRYRRHRQILYNSLKKLNMDLTKPEMIQRFGSKLQNIARGLKETQECDKCGLLFLFTSGLKRHYSSHLRTKSQIFGHGQKVLKRLRIWRYHSHKHKGLLRKVLLRYRTFNWNSATIFHATRAFYKCVLCTRNFYRPTQFINHMQRHTDEEPLEYRVNSRIFKEDPVQNIK